MKINPSEEKAIIALEQTFNIEIPRVSISEKIPELSFLVENSRAKDGFVERKFRARGYVDLCDGPNRGCFIDDEGHVIGLGLCRLEIRSLPTHIREFKNLKKLNLGINKLRSLPLWISELSKLELVQLFGNQLPKVPTSIFKLKSLTELHMGDNIVSEIPSTLIEMPSLMIVNFVSNRISNISKNIFDSTYIMDIETERNDHRKIKRVLLSGNPIEYPPMEIIKQGNAAVLSYFASLEDEMLPLNEVKVILVGDGGAGKTCLVKRFMGRGFDKNESQTHGINIENWRIESKRGETILNMWDFGGQEIMHATHQFFLSQRSLYILVLDGRKEEDPEYWLKHVQSFGGDSPVLIVLNKIDENPGFDINRRFLKRKYPIIQSFHRVSCYSGEGIEELSKSINNTVEKVEITRTNWPKAWFKIKKTLQGIEDHYITYDDFTNICIQNGVKKKNRQETLVTFLHDLGVVVHFPDFRLKDTHVLEPEWLTGAVYCLINSEILANNHGIISMEEISNLLSSKGGKFGYPSHTHAYIVDIMKKFELCYSIDDMTILVPDLLEVQEPEFKFDYAKSLAFRIDYDFLPRSILPRFIVKQHEAIYRELRWRTGVVLRNKTLRSSAVIKSDQAAKRIYINVIGDHVRDYLTVIRTTLEEINRTFEKLSYTERIPLHDHPEVTVAYEHLLRLEETGQDSYFPEGAEHSYSVQKLLGTVRIENKYGEQELIRMFESLVDRTDSEEKMIEKLNDVVVLQPNVFGMGVDISKIIKKFIAWRRKKSN